MDGLSEGIAAGSAPGAQALPKSAFGAAPAGQPDVLAPLFTGSGKEYFRIWIVNLLLIVATLGIYSAWAKVRRLQYFDRNTRIGGAVFDFRGDPLAILRGRVVAVVMLGLYHYAFGFSTAVALCIIGVLFLALPWLLRGAMRFRLQNTYYRGVPFAFTGSIAGAYAVFLPFLVLFVAPAASLALDPSGMAAGLIGLLYLAFPLLYGRLKAYQHGHVRFGAARSSYDVSPWRFYRFYLVALGLVLLIGIVLGIAAASSMWLFKDLIKTYPVMGGIMAFAGVAAGYLSVLLLFPYMVARTANLVWSNTSFPGITMQSDMSARAFARLQIVNVLLTVVTLGLFRPFAVVRIHKFRLAALTIIAEGGFEPALAVAAASAGSGGATGDGAADFFGFDLSL